MHHKSIIIVLHYAFACKLLIRLLFAQAAGSAGFGVTSPGYEDYEAAHSSRLPPVRAAAEAARPEIRTHYVETPNKNSKLQAWAEKVNRVWVSTCMG